MENCYLERRMLCTFDLKDDGGIYYEDLVLDWKQAAAERKLTCVECGAHVYLAAGPMKEPYFAHYDLENCDYGNGQESEELKKGKRLLYKLLKRSFPESVVQARYRMENGMYTTLYCKVGDEHELAVDYRLVNNSLEKYRLRDTFYQSHNMKPIYILGSRQEKDTKQIDWYQSLIQSSMGYLAFLDVMRETLTLKKSISYRLGNARKFKHVSLTYPIHELSIDQQGQMRCDFTERCADIEQQIQEEKLRYQRRQEKIKELKVLQEKQEEKERERLEAYRRAKLQEEQEHLRLYLSAKLQEEQERQADNRTRSLVTTPQRIVSSELNPALLEKCRRMIEEGNAHLVSKKYYDAIMGEQQSK